MDQQNSRSFIGIPGAIIVAAAIIAVAIIWTQQKPSVVPAADSGSAAHTLPQISMKPVSAGDHIYGNPNAPVKIVEYSDPSCPFCKMFNPVMEDIMSQYGPSGQVAWIYRQFPLDKPDPNGNVLHPLSGTQAEGFECAASLGGNDAFWKYEKAWFDAFPDNGADEATSLDQSQMSTVAKSAGLDQNAFDSCVASAKFQNAIEAQYTDGINAGVSGTPFIVVLTPSGSKIPLSGAQSFATMKTTIDTLLSAGTSTAQ
ncbi:MAG: thioredoxin domain-containing protein [Patescibacteria group bacterium]|nr:thioredoxin domain-containing protein [Patescibacteria group bacterium]